MTYEFSTIAKSINIKKPKAIINDVKEAVFNWQNFADEAQVHPEKKLYIQEHLAANLKSI